MPQNVQATRKVELGIVKGKQRYKYSGCGCNYTVEVKSTAKPKSMKKYALQRHCQLKNYCWIWIAVDRYRKRFINFVVGDRSTKTGRALWKKIEQFKMGLIASY